ncbi:ETC complex I subunit [Candidatus Bealeia paramacronuclearis]|uniref:ETC complex I subunit n=1 Tax=Candidatus Bealeia paramacronuclearis TaxID=1921001 RepID=A0ABZ2C6K8_9PROT|nr:ETC complex I subunit [Candidatus Bealeia paramacronuclearis]
MRIYKPAKSATQSGMAKTVAWIAEFESSDPLKSENLMGWVSGKDTHKQLRLEFKTLEDAIYFAKSKGLKYTISNPTEKVMRPKSYALNFTCARIRGS